MKKILLNLKVVMTLLLLIGATNVWGEEVYTLTFVKNDLTTSATSITKNGITWTLSEREDSWDGTANKSGYRFGSASNYKTLTISTDGIAGTITKIIVTGRSNNSGKTATVSAKVGDTNFSSSDDTWDNGNNQALTFSGSASGTIAVTITPNACGYILSGISVTYEESTTPTKTLSSIAVSGTPTKTEYTEGETFDPAGLTVTGTYSDNSTENITNQANWTITPSTLATETTSVKVTATVGTITSSEYTVNGLTVTAALPKITIDGTASGITTTDGTQSITVGGVEFGGYFKQYSTTALWLTSGTGYIYNKESFGKIKKITINYKSGGSGSAYQYIRLGNTILGTYSTTSTNGIEYITSTGGSSNTFTVTGDYEYFCISVSNKNLQASSIEIEYEEAAPDNREMPTASFENETVNAVVDDDFTITVTTNSDGAVTYSSSNENIATVDSSTGEVLAISAGTATITADIAGTTTYKPTSASYTIVIASAPLMGKGTEAEPYTVGDIITLGSNGNECWVGGTIVGFGVSEQQPDKSYKLNYTTDSENFAQSNLVISDDNGKIAAVELPSGSKIRTALNLPEHLNYIGAPIKVYGKLTNYFSQVGVKSTSDYRLTQQNVEISAAGWATACIPFDATISGDVTAYYVCVEDGKLVKTEVEGTIPAETGLLLKSNNGGEATATFTEATLNENELQDEWADNQMIGTVEEGGEDFEEIGYTYYILANGSNGIGFYWDGDNYPELEGMGAHCAQYKAVLAVPGSVSVKGFSFTDFDDEVDAINSINADKKQNDGAIYNLNGQRLNSLQKGLNIVNGKKLFVR